MKLLVQKIFKTPTVTEQVNTAASAEIEVLGNSIKEEAWRVFGRSLHIREVDAGSCNGCEIEISGLNSPYYDLKGTS